jgi:hypothetical protein
MRTFAEFLNQQPQNLKTSWQGVESSWDHFLHDLHDHLRDNMGKFDAHHQKFGGLSTEHPDQQLYRIVKLIEKGFKKMKEGLSDLGAHEML